jgi:hypothetical protein
MSKRYLCLVVCFLAGLLTGCGGGGNSGGGGVGSQSATGRATLTILWPQRSRLIPDASNSISVAITQGTTAVTQKLLARPANGGSSSVTFDPLPTGTLSMTATAFPNADGTGTAQATATIPLVIQANQNTTFNLTMNSTITEVDLSAPSTTLVIGQSEQMAASAKDANGNIVLMSAAKLQWSSSNLVAASVDANGKVTAVAAGSADISVTDSESGKSAKLTVQVNVPGQVSFQSPILYNITSPNNLVVADFDGDGKQDIVVGTSTSLVIFYGKGDGTFEAPQTILTWNGGVTPFSAADINGDGKPDIVGLVSGQFLVIENQGGRKFAAPIAVPLNAQIATATTGDFNKDGLPDVAVVTGNEDDGSSDVHIFLNQGKGTFTQVTSLHNGWTILAISAGDLNGDGNTDLLVSITTDIVGESGANTYFGDGTGHFTGGPGVGTASFNVDGNVIADFNGDGKADYAIANDVDGSVSVVFNTGNSTFGTPATYGSNAYPDRLLAADFDGDGAIDIMVENRDATFMTFMRNQNGLFPNPVQIPTGAQCGPIALGDFNGDGKPDVAVSSPDSNELAILLNNTAQAQAAVRRLRH